MLVAPFVESFMFVQVMPLPFCSTCFELIYYGLKKLSGETGIIDMNNLLS